MSAAATARVPTAHASRYLQQLCKHWSHKLPVSFTAEEGRVDFAGRGVAALMTATPDTLIVRVEAPDEETLVRMTSVVAEHLDRFAFREAPLPFDWRRGG